jgi:hypothetical protein
VAIEIAYIPHVHVFKFLQGEQRDMQTTVELNISKNFSSQEDVKKPTINNHFKHNWYGFKNYKAFSLVIFTSYKVSRFVSFDLIEWKLCL